MNTGRVALTALQWGSLILMGVLGVALAYSIWRLK